MKLPLEVRDYSWIEVEADEERWINVKRIEMLELRRELNQLSPNRDRYYVAVTIGGDYHVVATGRSQDEAQKILEAIREIAV